MTGLVDWMATNPATAAQARGTAQVEYRVLWSELGPSIIREAGHVLGSRALGWWRSACL